MNRFFNKKNRFRSSRMPNFARKYIPFLFLFLNQYIKVEINNKIYLLLSMVILKLEKPSILTIFQCQKNSLQMI